jgi:alkanesulfonate monooxygenase SsuD/methylene tetrahydromethanopterin reductase-like flavin-dependent oxidoreductase (luciferase family)
MSSDGSIAEETKYNNTLHEAVTSGQHWPSNVERFARLKESIQLIKKLWTEDWVDFKGIYYRVKL